MAADDIPVADRSSPPEVRSAGTVTLATLTAHPCPLPPPRPEEAAVWTLFPQPNAPVPALFVQVLDVAERARAARLLRPRDRRRFLLSHGLTRLVLGAWTGRDPADIAYVVSATGKPSILGGGPAFNLSHAGDGVLLAVTAASPVGVDLEPVRPFAEAEAVVARFFAPQERLAYGACAPAERDAAFFRLWTRKEAYVKALGGGLSLPLGEFAVSLDEPARVLRPLPDAPVPGPRLCGLPVPPGQVAALAGWCDRVVCRELVCV